MAMESHDMPESAEKMLQKEADATHTPLTGTMELLPLCNMDCRMCYVRLSKAEMEAQGRMLTCDEWLRIAEEACKEGMLFLLLTGGEPLLFPDFQRLYRGITQMGVVVQINTNGTLIDEKWADFFYETGVRRLNITLYGIDDATYGTLCGNPHGFTQVMRAASLLKERNIRFLFNCTLTPANIDQLPEFQKIAESFGVPLSPATYLFPGIRRGVTTEEQYRLTAQEAARARVYGSGPVSAKEAREQLAELELPPRLKGRIGFPCHAGHSDFSINWKGELLPCISFQKPKLSLLEQSFAASWKQMVDVCEKMPQCRECTECELQNVCMVCPAHRYSETGNPAGRPDYICRMTEQIVRELEKIAAAGETKAGLGGRT